MKALAMIVLALSLTACGKSNPNEGLYLSGAIDWFGGWRDQANSSVWTYKTDLAFSDSVCGYAGTYTYPLKDGSYTLKITSSNNAAGCFPVGTYSCVMVVTGTIESVAATGVTQTQTVACSGQTTKSFTR